MLSAGTAALLSTVQCPLPHCTIWREPNWPDITHVVFLSRVQQQLRAFSQQAFAAMDTQGPLPASALLLEELRRTICVWTHMSCYGPDLRVEVLAELVNAITYRLAAIGVEQPGALAQTAIFPLNPGALTSVFDAVQPFLPAPKPKVDVLNTDSLIAALRDGAAPGASGWVVNLGAGPNRHGLDICDEDLANCLVFHAGFPGVLFECLPDRVEKLQAWLRPD